MPGLKALPVSTRFQAFELWVAGVPDVEIAAKLGTARQTIGAWRKRERWLERAASLKNPDRVDPTGDLGPTTVQLRHGLARRTQELENICTGRAVAKPSQLAGIRLWFQLADVQFRTDPKMPPRAIVPSMEDDLTPKEA